MDFVNKFQSISNGTSSFEYRRVDDMKIGNTYKCLDFDFITTNYGRRIIIRLDGGLQIILPGRISNMVTTGEELQLLRNHITHVMYQGRSHQYNMAILNFYTSKNEKNNSSKQEKSQFQWNNNNSYTG